MYFLIPSARICWTVDCHKNKIFSLEIELNLNDSQFFFFFCNYRELQNASGEWMNTEVVRTPPRRGSITQGFIPTADIIRKSISRSWTISSEWKGGSQQTLVSPFV